MKKHLHNSLRALFLSLAVLLSLPMLAIKIDGINYRLFADRNEATVIENYGSKYQGEIVIPESVVYEGTVYSVTSIDRLAFNCCDGLTSVTIPNTVTSIGDGAFQGCNNVVSAHISDLEAWCNIDFGSYNSSPLFVASHFYINGEEVMDLVIPNGVTSIKDYAFASFNGTSVTIPNSVTSIGYCAFGDSRGLIEITIPNSVTSIGKYAFAYCSELLDVYCYAENVPSTQSKAFYSSPIADATLHVLDASIDSYKATAPWSSFGKIIALTEEETGIDELKGEKGKVKTAVYDLSGRRVQKAQKGVYIQNGKVVMVR